MMKFMQVKIRPYWPKERDAAGLNILERKGIVTVGDALAKTPAELICIWGFGRGRLRVLEGVLAEAISANLPQI